MAYLWAQLSSDTQQIAARAGTCSFVQSRFQSLANNFASIAGGAVYATDRGSLQIYCPDGSRATAEAACESWTNNTVQPTTITAAEGTVTSLQVQAEQALESSTCIPP